MASLVGGEYYGGDTREFSTYLDNVVLPDVDGYQTPETYDPLWLEEQGVSGGMWAPPSNTWQAPGFDWSSYESTTREETAPMGEFAAMDPDVSEEFMYMWTMPMDGDKEVTVYGDELPEWMQDRPEPLPPWGGGESGVGEEEEGGGMWDWQWPPTFGAGDVATTLFPIAGLAGETAEKVEEEAPGSLMNAMMMALIPMMIVLPMITDMFSVNRR